MTLGELIDSVKRTSSFGGSGEGPDIYKRVLGRDVNELAGMAEQAYPDVPGGSKHHALAARIATDRYGQVLPQLLGLGVEAAESAIARPSVLTPRGLGAEVGEAMRGRPSQWFVDTTNDLAANLRGGVDSVVAPVRAVAEKHPSIGTLLAIAGF